MLRSISPGRSELAEYDSGVAVGGAPAAHLRHGDGVFLLDRDGGSEQVHHGGSSAYFLQRHALFLTASLFSGMIAFQVPVRFWQQAAPWLFVLGVALLALLLARDWGGSQRRAALALARPRKPAAVEFMKLFVVLYAADYTVRKLALMHSFKRAFSRCSG